MKRKVSVLMVLVMAFWFMPSTQTNANTVLPAPVLTNQEKINCDNPAVRCDGVTVYFDIPQFDVEQRVYLKVGPQAVSVTSGQTNVIIRGLLFDAYYSAMLVYDVAQGCCWVTKYGSATSFKTVGISGVLVVPTPTPTPTSTPTPTPSAPVIVYETPTVTTAPETSTSTVSGSTTSTATAPVVSPSPTPTTNETTTVTTAPVSAPSVDYNQLRIAFELVLANFSAFVAFLSTWGK